MLLGCEIVTLGWILISLFSGNFMAYRAKSIALPGCDCAEAPAPKIARRLAYTTSTRFDLIERMRSKHTRPAAFSKSFRSISSIYFGKNGACLSMITVGMITDILLDHSFHFAWPL